MDPLISFSLLGLMACVLYVYLGYPLLICGVAWLFGERPAPPTISEADFPSAILLIAAHNEEQVIEERIRNALEQVYPRQKLQILIASDGSIDRTADIVRLFEEAHPQRVRLIPFSERRGKASVLNEVLPMINADIVVFSDANTRFHPHAMARLARWFCEDDVTVVCGKLILLDSSTGQNVDGIYWRFENFLKRCEGRLGALLGANGGIYAMRRADYIPVPSDTIIDDFAIPMLSKLHTRRRIVYDEEAVAFEDTPPRVRDEFRRRCRIGAGGFQSIVRLWPLLSPALGWTALAFFSHKVLRWFCPAFLVAAVLLNIALVEQRTFRVTLLLQGCFYFAASVGAFTTGMGRFGKALRVTTMFVSMNLALLLGFWGWLRGQQRGMWQRTARS